MFVHTRPRCLEPHDPRRDGHWVRGDGTESLRESSPLQHPYRGVGTRPRTGGEWAVRSCESQASTSKYYPIKKGNITNWRTPVSRRSSRASEKPPCPTRGGPTGSTLLQPLQRAGTPLRGLSCRDLGSSDASGGSQRTLKWTPGKGLWWTWIVVANPGELPGSRRVPGSLVLPSLDQFHIRALLHPGETVGHVEEVLQVYGLQTWVQFFVSPTPTVPRRGTVEYGFPEGR